MLGPPLVWPKAGRGCSPGVEGEGPRPNPACFPQSRARRQVVGRTPYSTPPPPFPPYSPRGPQGDVWAQECRARRQEAGFSSLFCHLLLRPLGASCLLPGPQVSPTTEPRDESRSYWGLLSALWLCGSRTVTIFASPGQRSQSLEAGKDRRCEQPSQGRRQEPVLVRPRLPPTNKREPMDPEKGQICS